MKQLYFILMGKVKEKYSGYHLAGIYGDVEIAKKVKAEIEGGNPNFEVKMYSGNFGLVEEEKGNE